MLGLADQYKDLQVNAGNLDYYGKNGEISSYDYPGTDKKELMGTGLKEVTQRDIDALAGFVLKNQKKGASEINLKTLRNNKKQDGLAGPTKQQEMDMIDFANKNRLEEVSDKK